MALHPKEIDLSLDRLWRLLDRLDHPEDKLPPVVHVAGTNGKGSTLAFLRAMLEAEGYAVHAYISPHLARFNERIRLAGELISDTALSAVLAECEQANADDPITFFEVTTAAAFLAYSRHPADVLLLEVGLGGRLDATNVFEKPLATAITPIDIDHTRFLGDTLTEIAGEKAGILKAGVPSAIAAQSGEALTAIEKRAEAVGAPLVRHGLDWEAKPEPDGFSFHLRGVSQHYPAPSLPGDHQIANAGLALVLAHLIEDRLPTSVASRQAGVSGAVWAARMQHLVDGPLPALLPEGSELWLDGGHNRHAAAAVAAVVKDWRTHRPKRPIWLVVGLLDTRPPEEYLAPFVGLVDGVRTVTIPGEVAALPADTIAHVAGNLGIPAEASDTVEAAVTAAAHNVGGPVTVLICGSLYFAGAVLRMMN